MSKKRARSHRPIQGLDFARAIRKIVKPLKPLIVVSMKRLGNGQLVQSIQLFPPAGFDLSVWAHKKMRQGKKNWVQFETRTLEDLIAAIKYEAFMMGHRATWNYWHDDFDDMYVEGVVSRAGLIRHLMKKYKLRKDEALEFVATAYGIVPKTQTVYLSDEWERRTHERLQTWGKRHPSN